MSLKVEIVINPGTSKRVTEALLVLIGKYEREYTINIQKDKKYYNL